MKARLGSLLFVAALASTAGVRAQQWFVVTGPRAEGSPAIVEVDAASVRVRGTIGDGVIRVTYEPVQPHGAGFSYRSFVGSVQFDCQRRLISITSAAYFALPSGGGERVGADSAGRQAGMPPELLRSIPVATQQALLRAACAITQTPS